MPAAVQIKEGGFSSAFVFRLIQEVDLDLKLKCKELEDCNMSNMVSVVKTGMVGE